uniref:WD_REPEATS_REGION domain-containing protein n=1 Tax=Syphacia muris TaxID=451379 RepID=A0A0N5AFE0_9BILA
MDDACGDGISIGVHLLAESGDKLNQSAIVLPLNTTIEQLQTLCNQLLGSADDPVPIRFKTSDGIEVVDSLIASIPENKRDYERGIDLFYYPEAVFRVHPVTRCTSSLPGHGEPVISVQFSPDAKGLASGSGDCTVRLWDLNTELPLYKCEGHKNWVLCIAWSPNGKKLASACKDGVICLWDPETGKQIGKKLTGHKQWINQLVWQPFHEDPSSRFLASCGKDGIIKIWDTINYCVKTNLTGHTVSVTCIRWGGEGLIYSGSQKLKENKLFFQDRTVKVWRVSDGVLCRTLTGHAHWINSLALNVEYVLRIGCFQPTSTGYHVPATDEEACQIARQNYLKVKGSVGEILASASDDFTIYLWKPSTDKKPFARLTGHQQLVNQVVFSPDARYIASASFDKSIKLWCGRTGKFLLTFRGHVQAVYQIAWSSDSRLLVSGSRDSTLKVWDVKKEGLCMDLPGHGDEVYAVDWSPDGVKVASGGKDKVLKLWRQ